MAIAGFRLKTAVKSSGSIDDGGVRFDPMLRGNLTECTNDVMVAIHIMPSYKPERNLGLAITFNPIYIVCAFLRALIN